jgi:hypothetical protein
MRGVVTQADNDRLPADTEPDEKLPLSQPFDPGRQVGVPDPGRRPAPHRPHRGDLHPHLVPRLDQLTSRDLRADHGRHILPLLSGQVRHRHGEFDPLAAVIDGASQQGQPAAQRPRCPLTSPCAAHDVVRQPPHHRLEVFPVPGPYRRFRW